MPKNWKEQKREKNEKSAYQIEMDWMSEKFGQSKWMHEQIN